MPRTRITHRDSICFSCLPAAFWWASCPTGSMRQRSTARANNSPQNMSEFRKRYLDGMRTKVGVSEAQIAEISASSKTRRRKSTTLHAQEKPLHDKIQQEHIDQIKTC